jgi:hypothetical protein
LGLFISFLGHRLIHLHTLVYVSWQANEALAATHFLAYFWGGVKRNRQVEIRIVQDPDRAGLHSHPGPLYSQPNPLLPAEPSILPAEPSLLPAEPSIASQAFYIVNRTPYIAGWSFYIVIPGLLYCPPSPLYSRPSLLYCHPERSEGSLQAQDVGEGEDGVILSEARDL